MKKKAFFKVWLHGLVALQLCALLTLLAPAPFIQAATTLPANQFVQCSSSGNCVNPLDSSIWIKILTDGGANAPTYNLGHFSKDGQLLQTFQIPSSRDFLTITFEPGDSRFYYEEITGQSPPVFTTFGYIDLQTGQNHQILDTATIEGGCSLPPGYTPESWYYNAARKQLYLPCTSFFNAKGYPDLPTRTAIIDTTTGKLVKLVDFKVLALHPDGGKLYAYREYYERDASGYRDTFYDLYLADDQTFQATTDKPIIQHQQYYTALTSFLVNSKTGLVYLTTRNCYAKCGAPQGAVVDRAGNFVVPFSQPKVMEYITLNEANNTVYGYDFYANSEINIFDGANVTGERLALSYWRPYAFDTKNNLIYAVDPSEGPGFGLLVVNGNTNSVLSLIKVQAPDASYTDKAKPVAAPPPGTPGRYFVDTGHTLSGKFLDYWQNNGGLAGFGFPVTEPFEEYNPDVGRNLTVQYFERTRFELHPENAGTPYEVELGLLGHIFSALTGPRVNGQFISGETSPVEGGLLFKETGHTVTGKFLDYWQKNGGLARHGLPLTQPTQEVNPIDGKTYLVQYFERSRLELHPEFAGTFYEVEMGHLGIQSLRAHGWPI